MRKRNWQCVVLWRQYTSIAAWICEPGKTKCADNHQCINLDNVCNGLTDCYDESDEDPVTCKGNCN